MRIVFTGGGTGGHITPLLPVIDVLRRGERDLDLYFLGVVTNQARELFAAYDVAVHNIPSGKLRRYASVLNIFDLLFWLPLGICLALLRMWWLMPEVVVSKGGYGSVPVVLAAWLYRIPILIHESDVIPGLANRKLAYFATIVAVGFEEARDHFGAQRHKVIVTGIPIRFELASIDTATAKKAFGLPPEAMLVLITGGSQGAAQINEVVLKVLPQLITEVHIIHLTGPDHFESVSAVANQLLEQSAYKSNYQIFPVLTDQMGVAMVAADIIVSRAGATTLAEIARLRKPSLLIPLPGSAQDNQAQNATVFEQRGAARVLDAGNVGPHLFHRSLEELITSRELRASLSRNVAAFDHPQAAADVAALSLKLADGLVPLHVRP